MLFKHIQKLIRVRRFSQAGVDVMPQGLFQPGVKLLPGQGDDGQRVLFFEFPQGGVGDRFRVQIQNQHAAFAALHVLRDVVEGSQPQRGIGALAQDGVKDLRLGFRRDEHADLVFHSGHAFLDYANSCNSGKKLFSVAVN